MICWNCKLHAAIGVFCECAHIGVMKVSTRPLLPLQLSRYSQCEVKATFISHRFCAEKNNLQQVFARTVALEVPFEQSLLTDVKVDSLGSCKHLWRISKQKRPSCLHGLGYPIRERARFCELSDQSRIMNNE